MNLYYKAQFGTFVSVLNTGVSSFQDVLDRGVSLYNWTDRQTDRHRPTDRQTDRQINNQMEHVIQLLAWFLVLAYHDHIIEHSNEIKPHLYTQTLYEEKAIKQKEKERIC